MTFLRAITFCLLGFLPLLLNSCIDGREEVWLNADGSGRADLSYDIPATAAKFQGGAAGVETLIKSILKDFPGASQQVSQRGDRLMVNVKLPFASADEISRLSSAVSDAKAPGSFQHLAGIFNVTRKLRTVDFTRTISPGKALPAAFIPASEFRNRKLLYILHLPVVPTESTANRNEDGGLTQIWEQPLAVAIRKPMVIHFKAKIPIPEWLICGAAGLILMMAGAVFLLMKRRWSRRMVPAASSDGGEG